MELEPPQSSAHAFLLPPIACPTCGAVIESVSSITRPARATSFDTCLRRCDKCGVGASNARGKQLTFIHRHPLANIPKEARCGALEVLSQALNVRSRESKRRRFGFSTSEDAVTWVVFSYLLRSGRLVPALGSAGLLPSVPSEAIPTLLLWGSPLDDEPRARMIASPLAAQCNELGEECDRRSEPDVIIDFGQSGLIFIEVKYLSGNDQLEAQSSKWQRYTSAGRLIWRFDAVKESSCYELARNWCLTKLLSQGRPAVLANLGPPSLFKGKEGARLDRFVQALDTDERSQFAKVSWPSFLRNALDGAPKWFEQFCRERGLTSSKIGARDAGR